MLKTNNLFAISRLVLNTSYKYSKIKIKFILSKIPKKKLPISKLIAGWILNLEVSNKINIIDNKR